MNILCKIGCHTKGRLLFVGELTYKEKPNGKGIEKQEKVFGKVWICKRKNCLEVFATDVKRFRRII